MWKENGIIKRGKATRKFIHKGAPSGSPVDQAETMPLIQEGWVRSSFQNPLFVYAICDEVNDESDIEEIVYIEEGEEEEPMTIDEEVCSSRLYSIYVKKTAPVSHTDRLKCL